MFLGKIEAADESGGCESNPHFTLGGFIHRLGFLSFSLHRGSVSGEKGEHVNQKNQENYDSGPNDYDQINHGALVFTSNTVNGLVVFGIAKSSAS